MSVLTLTLSEEGVAVFRDALICLNKFSDDVFLEAKREQFILTTLNSSKSAYASFKFSTTRFFSRYQYQARQSGEKFCCGLHVRALISLFRSRSGIDGQKDTEKHTSIDKCDVAIEDGGGSQCRFIVRIIFRNGLTSTHRLPFEATVPVHAKFNRHDAPHHWALPSRTLRQLMEHFGPGVEFLDISADDEHVNFTCFSEKTMGEDAVLKKPLQTSIAVEIDEFNELDVEAGLHIVLSVKDFRAIIQHAGITANLLSARYSAPAQPLQLSYTNDAIFCEFLIMTVGERGNNPAQRTKKRSKDSRGNAGPRIETAFSCTSAVPTETTPGIQPQHMVSSSSGTWTIQKPMPNASKASTSRIGAFDLRPSQKPPAPTMQSESLFVDDNVWEPVRNDEGDEEDAALEWDHSTVPNLRPQSPSSPRLSRAEIEDAAISNNLDNPQADVSSLEPTQRLSDVVGLALFPD